MPVSLTLFTYNILNNLNEKLKFIQATDFLLRETVFLNRSLYQEAERLYSLRKNV